MTGGSGGAGAAGASSGAAGASGGSGGAPTAGSGGSAGSAGSAGTASVGAGGSAGSTAGGAGFGGGGGSSAGGASGKGILTEGFEGPALPAGWDNFIGYVKNGMNPQGEYLIAIDTSKKHSGASSVHFHGGSTPAMLTRPLPANTNKLYVRVWVWLSRQIGNNPSAASNHDTLLGLRKISGMASDEVRFGEIKGAIGVNEVPTDALSLKQELWNKGMSIPKEKWVCLETAFLGDKPTHEFYAWADGTEVHKITGPDQWHAPIGADFLSGKFVEFIIGWQSFSGYTADVWADDLVLSNERVGCD